LHVLVLHLQISAAVILKDASNANNPNKANNGYVATGKIQRSKAVVRVVCVRTTRMMLATADKRISSVFNVFIYLFIYWF